MTVHPLEPLTADEITRAVEILRTKAGKVDDSMLVARVVLDEPSKDELEHPNVERRAAITVVPGPGPVLLESVVSLTDETVTSCDEVTDVYPALLFEESLNAIVAVKANEQWQEAMRARGIEDFAKVQLDPWPAGRFGIAHETNRRITRVLSYLRDEPTDNGYARPIEGVLVFVDLATTEVLEVQDHGVVPVPRDKGSYLLADNEPVRAGLRPLEIVQPEGPSFTIDGHSISWQRWSMRVSMDPYEGLVLHDVGYEDDGRTRSILHRAAISEMVVPYADPGPMHGWKNAFDAGEWGLGRMANSLALGCDCLGEIRYLDAVFSDEHGNPYDDHQRRVHPRRGLRDPVEALGHAGRHNRGATFATAGGELDRDGRQLRLRLLLVLLPRRLVAARGEAHRDHVDHGVRPVGSRTHARERHRARTCCTPSSAHVLHAARHGCRRPGERGLRGRRRPRSARRRQPDRQCVPAARDAARARARRAALRRSVAQPHVEDREPVGAQRSRRAGRVQARPRFDADAPGGLRRRPSAGAPRSPHGTCGSRRTRPTSAEPPVRTRTSRPAKTGCPAGPRRTDRSWAPTSCCGTRSASPTSPVQRTGRSCRSSTRASISCRTASSIAIPRSTFLLPNTVCPSTAHPRRDEWHTTSPARRC